MGTLVALGFRIQLSWMTRGLAQLNCRYLLNGGVKKLKQKNQQTFIFITFASLYMLNHRKKGNMSVTRYQFL